MEKNGVLNGNRMIAIFMNNYQKLSNDPEFGKFHISWDWLMPVVNEFLKRIIEEKEYDYYLKEFKKAYGGINETYEVLLEGVMWYNQNS